MNRHIKFWDEHHKSGAYARRSDPDTSKAAAVACQANKLEQVALNALAKLGGKGTIIEVVELTGIYESISPRFRPLVKKGLIRDSGERKKNPSGRQAIVWEIVKDK